MAHFPITLCLRMETVCCFCRQTNRVCFWSAVQHFKSSSLSCKIVKWILTWITQSSMLIELHVRVGVLQCALWMMEGGRNVCVGVPWETCANLLPRAESLEWCSHWALLQDCRVWERSSFRPSDLSMLLPIGSNAYWNLCFIHCSFERLKKKLCLEFINWKKIFH